MTILHPVRQRLSAARLYAVVVPAPFTPPDALVRRVEDLVSAGADIVQLDLDGWDRHDAVSLLNRCLPILVTTGRLLVVGHVVDVAADLGADALLIGPGQELSADLVERLAPQVAIGREVGDEVQVGSALESGQVDFLVLIGDRAAQVAARAHQLAPLDVPDAYEDPQEGSLPWFVDIGPRWPERAALPQRACRVRFHVSVPADSPVGEPSQQLRADVADLASRVAERWDRDEALVARREQVRAQNSAASTSFVPLEGGGRPEPARVSSVTGRAAGEAYDSEVYDSEAYDTDAYDTDAYDSEAYGTGTDADGPDADDADHRRSEREAGAEQQRSGPLRGLLGRVFRRGQAEGRDPGPGSEGAADGGVRE